MLRDVLGWEGFYYVSSDGDVLSKDRTAKNGRVFKGRKLKPVLKDTGYTAVTFATPEKREQKLLHVVVLEAFYGERPEGMEGCHNDGNRKNNKLENLRWDTRKGNFKDKHNHGTKQSNERSGNCKFTNAQIKEIRESGLAKKDIKAKYGISNTHLYRVLRGESRDLSYEDFINGKEKRN